MGTVTGAYLHQPNEAELRFMRDTAVFFLATGERTGGKFALVDERARRGVTVPLHLHRDDVESFYVLEGEVTFYIGDQAGVRAGAGSFAHVPGGTIHGFRIESDTARYLILTTPRHGEFYRAITLPSQRGGMPPSESIGGSTIEKACEDYGVEFVRRLPDEK